MKEFQALRVEKTDDDRFTRSVVTRTPDDLPDGSLDVRVHYSSLNYKDALSATGKPGVTRRYPHTPGIDAAGEVVACRDGSFAPGDRVIVTGFDLGMNTDGGFGQLIRVPGAWALPLPDGLDLKESMMLGTAGLTAALSVQELLASGVEPGQGPVLVTGATGGVGSLAVAVLGRLGFEVTAATGKTDQEPYLRGLGAAKVIGREEQAAGHDKPLLREVWAGVVDCVGGATLAAAIKATRYGGAVTCCGLVASPEVTLTVFPFILRGARLVGIDSAECPLERRAAAWRKLAGEWKPDGLADMVEQVTLADLDGRIEAMLQGRLKRRTLVDLRAS